MWASVRQARVRNQFRRIFDSRCGKLFKSNLCKHKSHTLCKPDTNLVMSPNFAEFLLDTANNGNEILAVLEDIVEVVETGGTDL